MKEIYELDNEIDQLERKLGFKDEKRKKRNIIQTEMEGFGKGFITFLDSLDKKVKQNIDKYSKQDYDFLKDEFEVALDEGALEMI